MKRATVYYMWDVGAPLLVDRERIDGSAWRIRQLRRAVVASVPAICRRPHQPTALADRLVACTIHVAAPSLA